jgi:hypothetical protein
MEIVTLGAKYPRPFEWLNSFIPVDPVNAAAAIRHHQEVKYAVGTSGFELGSINTFLKLTTADWTEMGAAGSASSAEFKEYSVALPTKGLVANFQFAGQETVGWTAVTGDTLWIGKTFFEDKTAPTAPENLTATVESSTVTLAWDASTDNSRVSGYVVSQDDIVLDTVTAKTLEVPDLADGTYTFSVVAIDASGNHSAASVDATIVQTAIHSMSDEDL